ncbi:hypothetical protein CHU32_12140 [Superficieibacter electus]|uniref:Uncharacterized protein n=1 Tax=Superficieibacter electus TaxID=2022662 RepID=A0A2P5GPF0_9ENTR|nr:hypothetical protein CHU33_09210 [Superficieibacter electus]POP48452.1 hypothetical protein CHU32_12140 [Superficieibacter electus]
MPGGAALTGPTISSILCVKYEFVGRVRRSRHPAGLCYGARATPPPGFFPPSNLHQSIIPPTPGCHFSVTQKLFFCHLRMSC